MRVVTRYASNIAHFVLKGMPRKLNTAPYLKDRIREFVPFIREHKTKERISLTPCSCGLS